MNLGPSSSLNKGIKESVSELIAYIDCGLNIPPNWLHESHKVMENCNCGIVSLQIKTNGTSLIDKSFVAQTYGLSSYTVCLPGPANILCMMKDHKFVRQKIYL